MRNLAVFGALVCVGAVLVGCGDDDSAPATVAESSERPTTAPPAAVADDLNASTPSPSASPARDSAVGSTISVAKYAEAYCRGIDADSQASLKLFDARATAEKPGSRSLAALKADLTADLTAFRAAVQENVDTLRRAGVPTMPNGAKFAKANWEYYDVVAVVDAALAGLRAIEAATPAAYAKEAEKVVVDLQDGIDERGATRGRALDELKPKQLDDAIGKAKVCANTFTL